MATLHEAQLAQQRAWNEIQAALRLRPSVVGLVPIEGGFGLKVVLPSEPAVAPPGDVSGVPTQYTVVPGRPVLAGTGATGWRKRLRERGFLPD